MSIIDVTLENIHNEHICCAITDKKNENCVGSKKDWMRERFEDGLVFKKNWMREAKSLLNTYQLRRHLPQ